MFIKPLILTLIFFVPLLYTRWKKGGWHTSISIIYYDEDLRIVWKFTFVAVAYTLSTYHELIPDLAAISLLGVAVFPEIEKPKIKKIHDTFAITFFFMMGWYIHPLILLGMILFFTFTLKKMSLYWIEMIGMGTIIAGLFLKDYGIL